MTGATFNPVAPVDCRRGAPMGRESGWRESVPAAQRVPTRIRLSRLPMAWGGYDRGGAYWGLGGDPVWCASTRNGDWCEYFRAPDRKVAKAIALAEMPGAAFFR